MKTETYLTIVKSKLETMNIGDSFSSIDFIIENWETGFNFQSSRSFDVYLCKVRKLFPEKQFRKVYRKVVRLK